MTRRPAFDPARLGDDLDQLLPPPPSSPLNDEPATAQEADPQPALDIPAAHTDPPSSPANGRPGRGSGGRPRRTQGDDAAPAVSAVRIPKPLYDAVVNDLLAGMIERPSYAQIVAWTCEDHPDDVLAELKRAANLTDRAPRGRKLATEVVSLALRFRPDERRVLDDLVARSDATGRITRTAAVAAALRVAVKRGLSAQSDPANGI